jgi:hypothetical protein
LNKECGIDFHQVKITYDHITEAEVPGAIKRLTGDPLVAFFQIQLFFEEKLITKYETFVAVLSLFESRDFKRELEYFAERGNVKDIRDSLFKKWLSELDNQDIDHGRLNDLRVLIETPSQLNSIDSKAIYDKLVSRYSACHIRFCTGMN